MAEQEYQDYKRGRLSALAPPVEAPPAAPAAPPDAGQPEQADTPVSPPADETTQDMAPDDTLDVEDTPDDLEADEPPARRPNRTQRRFQQLTQRLRERETENAALAAERAALQQQNQSLLQLLQGEPEPPPETERPALPDVPAAPVAGRPQRDAYPDQESYLEAVITWQFQQREQQSRAEHLRRQMLEAHTASVQTAQTQHDDWQAVIEASTAYMAPHLEQALIESGQAGELMYYLAQHPDDMRDLNRLTPRAVTYALGQLAERTRQAAAPAPSPPEPAPPAPPPITPVGGGGHSPPPVRNPDTLPVRDYINGRRSGRIK